MPLPDYLTRTIDADNNPLVPSLSAEAIELNKKRFIELILGTNRHGAQELVTALEKTDFFIAPASSKYHSNFIGGLCYHSLNVYQKAMDLKVMINSQLSDESITISTLLHDLCKINSYDKSMVFDKEFKEKTGRWRKIEGWKVNNKIPLGHGEKSVILAIKYITLNVDEILAIRWHMSAFDPGVHFQYPSGNDFNKAHEVSKLVRFLQISDQIAEFTEDAVDLFKD